MSIFSRLADNLELKDENGYRDARNYRKCDVGRSAVSPVALRRKQGEGDVKQQLLWDKSDVEFKDAEFGHAVETEAI